VGNNATFSGATTPTLTLTASSVSMSGNVFRAWLTNPAGSNVSGTAKLTVTGSTIGGGPTGSVRIINIFTRAMVGTGANILIPGIFIGGSSTESLLIRADGPALTQF